MKTLLLLLTLTFLSISSSQGGEAAVDVKKVTMVANSQAEAEKWKLDELPHKEWLAEISVKGWSLLHESETKEWHFAVFRAGDRLIFWKGNKKGINTEEVFALRSVGSPSTTIQAPRKPGEDQPEFAVITHEFSAPGISVSYYNHGSIIPIRTGFKGKIRIEFSVKIAGSFAPAFDQIVEWK